MKQPLVMSKSVILLSVSRIEDDHHSLTSILKRTGKSAFPTATWTLQSSLGLESALAMLREKQFPIIVSERDLSPGTWKQILAAIEALPNPPLLIVTSRLADEGLWGEVLNLGGWDVLAKPFDAEEVRRVLHTAWLHWQHNLEYGLRRTTELKMATAS